MKSLKKHLDTNFKFMSKMNEEKSINMCDICKE